MNKKSRNIGILVIIVLVGVFYWRYQVNHQLVNVLPKSTYNCTFHEAYGSNKQKTYFVFDPKKGTDRVIGYYGSLDVPSNMKDEAKFDKEYKTYTADFEHPESSAYRYIINGSTLTFEAGSKNQAIQEMNQIVISNVKVKGKQFTGTITKATGQFHVMRKENITFTKMN